MGKAAAEFVHGEIVRLVSEKGAARMIMACAPSQNDYYESLVPLARADAEIWRKVHVFHMDDYIGLTAEHPASFRYYLQQHFLNHVPVASFHPLHAEADDPEAEAKRYSALLAEAPVDVISMGIGENGHIAFNDPPVADFDDKDLVKIVELDPVCRQQQVNDGCFAGLDDVPKHALSLTLPVFARAGLLACIVPTVRKARAVRDTLFAEIGPACPATLLRRHPNARLFLDRDAASLLPGRMNGI